MEFTTDKISVIVAAYNAEKTLSDSIQSILNQTYSNLEVIIVDDKSKDGTLSLAHKLAEIDARINVIACPQNGGPAVARNAALDIASGEWIAVVDSDDLILPERFEAMLGQAKMHKVDIIFDNLFYVTPHNGVKIHYISPDKDVFGILTLERFIKSHRKSVDIPNLGFLKPLIRHSLIQKDSLRYDAALKIGEDAMLIMDLMAKGAKATLIKDAYYMYHRYDGSISSVQGTDSIKAITNSYKAYLEKYHHRLDLPTQTEMNQLIEDNIRRIQVGEIVDDLFGANKINAMIVLLKSPIYFIPVLKSAVGRVRRFLRRR
jgi:succinoglycan biosynthesis protein ExoO